MTSSATIPKTMKAVVLTGHGGLEKLVYKTDVKVPVPAKRDPTDWRKSQTSGPSAARENLEAAAPDGAWEATRAQVERNGDSGKTLIMKVDVEGAEWDSFLATPAETFEHIAQLVVEFHHTDDEKYVRAIKRLKEFFIVAHVHYNNFSCRPDIAPFPAWAFEVLLVNTRVAHTDGTPGASSPTPLDAPNNPTAPDCQRVS